MNNLSCSVFTEEDIPSTIDCIVKIFLYDEPMTKSLGITESEFRTFAKAICERTAKEKMSYVCKDGATVVGFCLNEDLVTEPFSTSMNITSKMDPIFAILSSLDEEYLKNKERLKGRYFHAVMAGSLKEYRNKGIVKELASKSWALAKKKGFSEVVGEATNIKSQNLLQKYYNFNIAAKIDYETFEFEGKFPFKDINEKSCTLMSLKLK